MSEHTPGPWVVDFDLIQDKEGYDIASTFPYGDPYDEIQEANARLIAAAPALLEACKAFIEAYTKSLQMEKADVAVRMAQQAIDAVTESDAAEGER